jgi:hypothetical protein
MNTVRIRRIAALATLVTSSVLSAGNAEAATPKFCTQYKVFLTQIEVTMSAISKPAALRSGMKSSIKELDKLAKAAKGAPQPIQKEVATMQAFFVKLNAAAAKVDAKKPETATAFQDTLIGGPEVKDNSDENLMEDYVLKTCGAAFVASLEN